MNAQKKAVYSRFSVFSMYLLSIAEVGQTSSSVPHALTVFYAARNLTAEEKKAHREVRWDDKEVCGCFLVRFCPHDLFVNTKSDLGMFLLNSVFSILR